MTDFDSWLRPRVKTMQIIALALPIGATVMTVIAVVVRHRNPAPPFAQPMITFVAAAFLATIIAMSFVLPKLVREAQLKQLAARGPVAPEQLINVCQSTLIIGLALIEGSIFFCAIAYMTEGQLWILPGIAVGLALMGLRVPTETSVVSWLGNAGERINELQQQ